MQYTDQVLRKVNLDDPPGRIISLVPSQTELLADLGLEQQIVGITKFCIHPENIYKTKPRVGGTKSLHHDLIRSLSPDLIIGNKEENREEDILLLEKEFPVWLSDVSDLPTSLSMIHDIGEITNRKKEAEKIIADIRLSFTSLTPLQNQEVKVIYLIWKNPYMLAGSDTFINSMLEECGFTNACSHISRYPSLNIQEIADLDPEIIMLSSEPYPFNTSDIKEFNELFPNASVIIVNGEYFSWYGSRLLKAPQYFNTLIAASTNNSIQNN